MVINEETVITPQEVWEWLEKLPPTSKFNHDANTHCVMARYIRDRFTLRGCEVGVGYTSAHFCRESGRREEVTIQPPLNHFIDQMDTWAVDHKRTFVPLAVTKQLFQEVMRANGIRLETRD